MKKLLSWAIVICMVLSLMPVTAQAASGSCGENVSWSLENGVLTISGTGSTDDYTTGQTPWYSSRNAIRSVVVSDGVTRIGNRLLEGVAAALPPDRRRVTLLFPFSEGALAEQCRKEGAVEYEEYVPEGLRMTVTLGARLLEKTAEYEVEG